LLAAARDRSVATFQGKLRLLSATIFGLGPQGSGNTRVRRFQHQAGVAGKLLCQAQVLQMGATGRSSQIPDR